MVLMGGMGVACVIAVCEFVWKSRKVAVEERVSYIADTKFIVYVYGGGRASGLLCVVICIYEDDGFLFPLYLLYLCGGGCLLGEQKIQN